MNTQHSTKSITTLLIDDHPVVRDGFRHLLENTEDICVVAEAGDGETGIDLFKEFSPSVVILDLSMAGIGGLETIRRILAEDDKAKILVFSMHGSETLIRRTLEAGATGYLTKQNGMNQMVEAVRSVARGKIFIDSEYVLSLASRNSPFSPDDPLHVLSAREFQMFKLFAEGKSVTEIAALVSISPRTVGVHQTNIMKKLALQNASQLVRLAIRYNVIEP